MESYRLQNRIVTFSGSEELQEFYRILVREFKKSEVEPIEVFERELGTGNFIFTSVFDSSANRTISSGSYGSVFELDEKNGALGIRFTFTEVSLRGSGVSQTVNRLLIDEAFRQLKKGGRFLQCLICEAVDRSEHYWNTLGVSPGEGMKRIYGELPSGEFKEISYEMPPIEWNADGSPIGEGEQEHLMILWRENPNDISATDLKRVLKAWWKQWYIRPVEDFDSSSSHKKHVDCVTRFLNEKVIAGIELYGRLRLFSLEERKKIKE